MKSPSAGLYCILLEFNFGPSKSFEVKDPQVIHIAGTFSSEHQQVRDLISAMWYVLFQEADSFSSGAISTHFFVSSIGNYSIESLIVGSSTSEDDDLLVFGIVVHRAVREMRRSIACGGSLLPLFVFWIVDKYLAEEKVLMILDDDFSMLLK